MSKHIPPIPSRLTGFTPLELNKLIPVDEAARVNGLKTGDAFRKNYPHLIRRIGQRKLGVRLFDALTLPAPDI
jgi:hypothetical protein